jgi:hypothetical protein
MATILLHPQMCSILYKTGVFASPEMAGQVRGMDLAHSLYAAQAGVLSRLLQGQVVSVTTDL